MNERGKRTVCLVCSRGGHLEQMRQLEPFYQRYRHYFVLPLPRDEHALRADSRTLYLPDINEGRGSRNPALLLTAVVQSFAILLRFRPRLVISTGAGIAVPVLIAAWVLRVPSVYIESFARIQRPSRSGRACYRLASLFVFQHAALQAYYPRAVYGGSIYAHLR